MAPPRLYPNDRAAGCVMAESDMDTVPEANADERHDVGRRRHGRAARQDPRRQVAWRTSVRQSVSETFS